MRAAPRSPSPQHFTHRGSIPPPSLCLHLTKHPPPPPPPAPAAGLSPLLFFVFFLKDRSRQVRALSEQHCVPKPPCFECGEELKRERKRGEDGSLSFFFSRRAQGAPGLVSEALIGVNTLQMRFMQKKTRFVLNSCFRCDAN